MSAISYIVKGCCKAVAERLTPDFIKVPATKAEWLNVSKRFEDRWNYPHALGAIDGKHVRIQKPKNGGSFYYNYKHMHSIILMAIAGICSGFWLADGEFFSVLSILSRNTWKTASLPHLLFIPC